MLTPAEARKVLVDVQASVPLELPACDIEEKTITQDRLEVSLTIVRPAGSRAVSPAFIFVHGGGWILGDFPTHERFVRDLVAGHSYSESYLDAVVKKAAELGISEANVFVLANKDQFTTPRSVTGTGYKLWYLGEFECRG